MEPLTEQLPFLVVHGEHGWKALVIASTAAVCGTGAGAATLRGLGVRWENAIASWRTGELWGAGAPEEAARWDAIYRRFDTVLDDRRRLIALILWED